MQSILGKLHCSNSVIIARATIRCLSMSGSVTGKTTVSASLMQTMVFSHANLNIFLQIIKLLNILGL